MRPSLAPLRALLQGILADPPACPHCSSADVRLSRRPNLLSELGVLRLRCRSCMGHFYLRRAQRLVVQERYARFFDRPTPVEAFRPTPAAPPPDFSVAPSAGEPPAVDLAPLDLAVADHSDR